MVSNSFGSSHFIFSVNFEKTCTIIKIFTFVANTTLRNLPLVPNVSEADQDCFQR